MEWIWGAWAVLGLGMLAAVTAGEASALRSHIDGANGLTLLMSVFLVCAGSFVVAALTAIQRGAATAAIVVAVSVVAIAGSAWIAFWFSKRVESDRPPR